MCDWTAIHRVDGKVDELGYYCFAFDFLDVVFQNEPLKPDPPTPVPTIAPPASISLTMTCSYTMNGMVFDCESVAFSQLVLNTCSIVLQYEYKIVNMSSGRVRVNTLVNDDLVNLLAADTILDAFNMMTVKKDIPLDICTKGGKRIQKSSFAVASPVDGGLAATAQASVAFIAP